MLISGWSLAPLLLQPRMSPREIRMVSDQSISKERKIIKIYINKRCNAAGLKAGPSLSKNRTIFIFSPMAGGTNIIFALLLSLSLWRKCSPCASAVRERASERVTESGIEGKREEWKTVSVQSSG